MAGEPDFDSFLAATEPLYGLSREDSDAIVRFVLLGPRSADHVPDAMMEQMQIPGAPFENVVTRWMGLGIRYGRWTAQTDFKDEGGGDPLAALFAGLPSWPEGGAMALTPDVRSKHKYAQAALLDAICRAAETATEPLELQQLADAYLTLPAPGEDDDES